MDDLEAKSFFAQRLIWYRNLSTATASLLAAGTKTLAIDVGGLNSTGQATSIANATGGQLLSGGYTQAGSIIQSALTASLLNYSLVSLAVRAPTGVDVTFSPVSYSGSFNRSASRSYEFDVTFTGLTEGSYTFDLNGLVDGSTVATEIENVTVGNAPEPSSWSLMTGGFLIVFTSVLRQIKRRGSDALHNNA